MNILIDTHYLIWAFMDTQKISPAIHQILLSHENDIYYSQTSLWEISIKYALGKLSLGTLTPEQFYFEVENSFMRCRTFNNKELIT
ncbi:MAG: PIN domain nuclease, partial [Candidatus Marinimicrobia bacterium]|nr:PIN domain nuclease [Candidatus Neomarinimicrobiota bacterium]